MRSTSRAIASLSVTVAGAMAGAPTLAHARYSLRTGSSGNLNLNLRFAQRGLGRTPHRRLPFVPSRQEALPLSAPGLARQAEPSGRQMAWSEPPPSSESDTDLPRRRDWRTAALTWGQGDI